MLLCWLLLLASPPAFAATLVMVGDFSGESKGVGQGLKLGLDAALAGRSDVIIDTRDHGYQPQDAAARVREAAAEGPLAFVANTETASIAASLAALRESGAPMIGFFSGLDALRSEPTAINLRPSYRQEADYLIRRALANGFQATDVCAYVQGDEAGLAGLRGIRDALAANGGAPEQIKGMDTIINAKAGAELNNIGPVGVYTRNTLVSRDGYGSLKEWEASSGNRCKLVISAGVHTALSKFVGYSRYKGEGWTVAMLSTTGAETLREAFTSFRIDEQVARRVVVAQVVPALTSDMPLVAEARAALGDDFTTLSLEGYMVGKMVLALIGGGAANGADLLAAAKGKVLDIGGFALDFSSDNQGSDYVSAITLTADGWVSMDDARWAEWAK